MNWSSPRPIKQNISLIKRQYIYKMDVAWMRMLRWMCGKIKKNKIKNECFRKYLEVATMENKVR